MRFELANFDSATFLKDVWQQKPLLIRRAFAAWENPLAPDELAGLACEDAVESRLIVAQDNAWQLEHGPIPETRFGHLGEGGWTLLVQAVDQHVPDVAALIEPFRFIPNWRIDDVMVSYATPGGGVGPHFDHYDVFLVQGMGRRRWRIGQACDDATPLLPHDDLRLLADFQPVAEWVLEPGDMLYVPPGIAHDGVAVDGDCMTYSVGFRAPSQRDLIGAWADDVAARLGEDRRYRDSGLSLQSNPGEITPDALDRVHALLAEALQDRAGFAAWFGRFTSARKLADEDWTPETPITLPALRAALARRVPLERNPASRFAFVAGDAGAVELFVDGESHACTGPTAAFARMLCAQACFTADPALAKCKPAVALIADLYNAGSLGFAEEEG